MNADNFTGSPRQEKHNIVQPDLANLLNNSTTRSTDYTNMDTDSSEQDLQEIKEYISSIGNQAASTSSIGRLPEDGDDMKQSSNSSKKNK